MGISQTRTLDRLDADKRKQDAKSQARSDYRRSPGWEQENNLHWQGASTRSFDWSQERNFRYDYGARKDPNHKIENTDRGLPARKPAKARLSFSREISSASFKEPLSRQTPQAQRTEWRPVMSGNSRGASKSLQSSVSHTPSPRPQREGDSLNKTATPASRHDSEKGSAQSQGRRPALERLSLPAERIPLAESGRLQEVEIQVLVDIISPIFPGGNDIPSGSRNPNQNLEEQYDPNQDRSPIRSLSEDRLHVSLRLGPLYSGTEEGDVPQGAREAKKYTKPAKSSGTKPTNSRKRSERSEKVSRSPAQTEAPKRRRTTKGQNSPRRRTPVDPTKSSTGADSSSRTQPIIKLIPASRKKGTDFRSGPPPLP